MVLRTEAIPCHCQCPPRHNPSSSLIKNTDSIQDTIYMERCAPINQQIILSTIFVLSESLLLCKDFNAILRKQNRHSFS